MNTTLTIPCGHDGTDATCTLCRVFRTHDAYNRSWGGPGVVGAAKPAAKKPLPQRPACVHLGPPTGETAPCDACGQHGNPIPILGCALHGECTAEKTASRSVAGVAKKLECCRICRDHSPRKVLQIEVTADGLGDHLLGLTAAEGLRRQHPDAEIVYCCKHQFLSEWVKLCGGYDRIVTSPVEGATTFKPHDTYERQLAERTRKPRWEYYAEVCGAPAALPPFKPLPAAATAWARQYAGAVVLCPWSSWKDRCWPLTHWMELERLLRAAGCRVVVADCGDNKRDAVFRCERVIRRPAAEVMALLSVAACVVGNDSGMMHVAGFVRAPAVALCSLIRGEQVFGLYPTVKVLNGTFACTGCNWRGPERTAAGCLDTAHCGSLAAITPERVLQAVEEQACGRGQALTLLTPDKLAMLRRAVTLTADVPGAMAELGCYRGGSALAMATAGPKRTLHLFDTFEGLPADDADGPHRQGEFAADEGAVRELLAGYPVELHAGLFPATAAGLESETYSVVHIDADLYDSTRDAIEYFWPRLNAGGRLVFDDWLWERTPGVSWAVREAFAPEQVEQTAEHQCQIIKRRE